MCFSTLSRMRAITRRVRTYGAWKLVRQPQLTLWRFRLTGGQKMHEFGLSVEANGSTYLPVGDRDGVLPALLTLAFTPLHDSAGNGRISLVSP
jgi:hypothetical protein